MSQDTTGADAPKTPSDSTDTSHAEQAQEKAPDASQAPAEEAKKPDPVPYDRFSKLNAEKNELKSRLEALEKENADRENKKLEEQQKFEELYKKEQEARMGLETRLKESSLRNAFVQTASGLIEKDAMDMAFRELNRESVTINDDGNVEGMEDAVKSLIESRPFLKAQSTTQGVNSAAIFQNSATNQTLGDTKYTKAQVEQLSKMSEKERNALIHKDPGGWAKAIRISQGL